MAVLEGGQPTVIANAEGQRTTPSVVAYTKNGDKLVGQIAKRQGVMNPRDTFYSVKRFVGRRYDEVSKETSEVAYEVVRDSNGILSVSAKDKASGKEQSITISGASTLDDKEVERMVKDAESNAEADRQRREKIDTKNNADSLAYQVEKQLKDFGDKVPANDKERVEGMVKELRQAVQQDNYDRMKSLTEELQQAMMQIGSSMYADSGSANGNNASGSGGSSSDGDEVEVDDRNWLANKKLKELRLR